MEKISIFKETLTPPSCHCAAIAEFKDGNMFSVWYTGSYETSGDTVIMGANWNKEKSEWSDPQILVDLPDICVGNPVLFSHSNGELWMFYVVLYGENWTSSKIVLIKSKDKGETWGQRSILYDQQGLMTKTKPFFDEETVILPVYDERHWCSQVLISEPPYNNWNLYGDTTARGITIQPTLIEQKDETLVMYSRSTKGRIYKSLSFNRGLSWTASQPTELKNSNSGIDILRLNSGRWVLIMNDLSVGRYRLVMRLSEDEGKTWSYKTVIEDGEGEFSYPFMIQAQNGQIHAVYTDQRISIKHLVVNEDELMK